MKEDTAGILTKDMASNRALEMLRPENKRMPRSLWREKE